MALRALRGADGQLFDRALVVRFAAPDSATGDDVVELHLHGGTAVTASLLSALTSLGLTPAAAGAFTRRAFDNGKLDLAQVEALGDLIGAETDAQRRAALARTGNALADRVDGWRRVLIEARAEIEATLDFAEDEGVPPALSAHSRRALTGLAAALAAAGDDCVRGELIRDGVAIIIVGPVNAGKSTLFNALVRRDVAMVSAIPGTTRDLIEARINLRGQLVVLIDTAGRRDTLDPLERQGIARAAARAATADLVIDLGSPAATDAIAVAAKCDHDGHGAGWRDGVLHLSAQTGDGLALLEDALAERIAAMAGDAEPPLVANARQRSALDAARVAVDAAVAAGDAAIVADELRAATVALASLIGRVAPERLLDEIFARFCIGK
jgi:tRNA modification GTPase